MSLKDLRKEANVTQAYVARKIGVSQAAVAMWEAGEVNPSVNNLVKLAEIFDCTVDEILNKKGE